MRKTHPLSKSLFGSESAALRPFCRLWSSDTRSRQPTPPAIARSWHWPAALVAALVAALSDEEQRERETDRQYWAPLRAELEQLRRRRRIP